MQLMMISSLLATVAMVTSQQSSPATQGLQVTAQQCVSKWSDWLNRDKPDTDGGDYEQMTSAEKAAFCPGGFVDMVECETVAGTASHSSGETLSANCTVQEGLRCNNADNAPAQCSDFRIRYRCHCPGEDASTSVVASVSETVATQAAAITTEITEVHVPSEVNVTVISPIVTFPPDTLATIVDTDTITTIAITTPAPDTPTVTSVAEVTTATPTQSEASRPATGETFTPLATSPETTPATTTTTSKPTSLYPSLDEILEAFRKLTQTEYFQRLPYQDQILLLELTSGGQAGQITEILDSQGWERVLSFMYGMPFNYFDTLMRFVLSSLEKERLLHAGI